MLCTTIPPLYHAYALRSLYGWRPGSDGAHWDRMCMGISLMDVMHNLMPISHVRKKRFSRKHMLTAERGVCTPHLPWCKHSIVKWVAPSIARKLLFFERKKKRKEKKKKRKEKKEKKKRKEKEKKRLQFTALAFLNDHLFICCQYLVPGDTNLPLAHPCPRRHQFCSISTRTRSVSAPGARRASFFFTIPHPCLFLPPLTKQPGQFS